MARTTIMTSIAFCTLVVAQPAFAAICAVPEEVILRTEELGQKVKTQVDLSEQLLINEEKRQRELLLAALKVITRQESGSGQQTAMVTRKSAEAAAETVNGQRMAYQIADAKDRYGATGFDSCGLQSKAQAFYAANQGWRGRASSVSGNTYFRPGQYGSPRNWAELATSNKRLDAESLFSGGAAANDYINFVAGAPVEQVPEGAGRQVFTLEKNRRDVRRSLAKEIMSSIAAENDATGPRASLIEVTKHWTGDDGGAKWASSMASQPLRAVLLDAVRIEAANITVLAYQVKSSMRTELGISGYALARTNDIIFGKNGDAPTAVSAGGDRRAALE